MPTNQYLFIQNEMEYPSTFWQIPMPDSLLGNGRFSAVDCSVMPRYRIHRIKQAPLESFRWAPHTGGLAVVKPKDYDFGEEIHAETPYAAWKSLSASEAALRPGDLFEDGSSGALLITKYIGFEPAQWFVPEPKPERTVSSSVTCESSFDPAPQEL